MNTRKCITTVLAVIIAVSVFTMPTVAFVDGTASMDVSITLTEDDVTPPEDTTTPDGPDELEPSSPDFIINIPAGISLNEQKEVLLTWVNYRLEGYDSVLVYIDAAKTYVGEVFYLTTGDGSTDAQRIPCYITSSAPGYEGEGAAVPSTHDFLVAEFVAMFSQGETPISLGMLKFETPGSFFHKDPGTYTGKIHFKIKVNVN